MKIFVRVQPASFCTVAIIEEHSSTVAGNFQVPMSQVASQILQIQENLISLNATGAQEPETITEVSLYGNHDLVKRIIGNIKPFFAENTNIVYKGEE